MNLLRRENFINRLSNVVKGGLLILFLGAIFTMLVAAFMEGDDREANIGSFDVMEFNKGWDMKCHGETTSVTLPCYIDCKAGDEVILSNTLPDDLTDGMSMMVRASMEDVIIYVNGRLREEYSTNSVKDMCYHLPSAYVVVPLDASDAGKPVTLHITIKSKGSLNAITIGHGNNVWFKVIVNGLPVAFTALVVFISGVIMSLTALLLIRKYKMNALGYLGVLVMDITAWLFSESVIRQLIFQRPSLSQYFSYITLELIGAFACMYFDAVQHKQYHKRYVKVEALILIQTTINLILHYFGIAEMYRTVPISHVLEGLCAVLVIVNIVTDIRTGRIRRYRINVVGCVFFIAMALVELARFYLSEFVIFGPYMCIGLIGLMISTTIQAFYDVVKEFRAHEKRRKQMTSSTIETIASAIDARDEYTGGHSERVGFYARCLAKEIASEYMLTEEDILRIHYIGLIHDIGKIGVAESVLNKAGKLTDEEFSLMKRHTEIGYEMISSLGNEIEGVLDGIRSHHERYDGGGYPDGLKGEEIPLVARILCLADSYDAMTSNRVYRKRLTSEEVRNELVTCAGTQFDPKLAEVFLRLLDRGELHENTVDGMASNEKGEVLHSARLEDRLQKDTHEGKRIIHASHVRMLCYIIKLMEKKGKDYAVLFIGPGNFDELTDKQLSAARRSLAGAINAIIRNHDVTIRYDERYTIVALYDVSDLARGYFIDSVKKKCPDISYEWL